MKHGIFELSIGQIDLWKKLEQGYMSSSQKLENMFFDYQPEVKCKTVVTKEYNPVQHIPPTPRHTDPEISRGPNRIFSGRSDIIVIYPRSGRQYPARIKTLGEVAAIEPIKDDRAFWLVNRKDLDLCDVLDLNVVEHIRQYHNKEGREIMSNFR